MRIDPDVFWAMSLQEFLMAFEGFAEFHSDGKPPPMQKSELDSLMERYPD